MSRSVRLTLCTSTGQVLGTLPAFDVATPWWPDVEPVVAGARAAFGLEVVVLRLLEAEGTAAGMGGGVRYLAELSSEIPASVVLERADQANTADEPLRAPWARPGGSAATLVWAGEALAAAERPRSGPAVQVKSWNLSSVWRIPTDAGDAWCKRVPAFMAHEGAVIELVGAHHPALVPLLVAADPDAGTVLMSDVPGEDLWDASEPMLLDMVRRLVGLQAAWALGVDELLAADLPDWRAAALAARLAALAGRSVVRALLTPEEGAALDAFVGDAARRLDELAACGLPDTLVHGDFNPGNWRSDGASLVLLDWGDSGVGNPLLDMPAFLSSIEAEDVRARVRDAWLAAWGAERPNADPWRAAELIAPLAAMRQAVIYRGFLDGIEPAEHRYHGLDVPEWTREALRLAAGP